MTSQPPKDNFETILSASDNRPLTEFLSTSRPAEIASLIEALPAEDQMKIFRACTPRQAAALFEYLDVTTQNRLLDALGPTASGTILNEMDSKVAAVITGIMASAARKGNRS